MNDLMLDIETMGVGQNAPITSIGAVFFDPMTGELGETFYSSVSLEEEMSSGATPDASTIIWWLKQSKEAQTALLLPPAFPNPFHAFYDWAITNSTDHKTLKVWGNSPVFDNELIRAALARRKLKPFWHFANDRDVRTIAEIGRQLGYEIKKQPFNGEKHNALEDACHQAKCVSEIYKLIF